MRLSYLLILSLVLPCLTFGQTNISGVILDRSSSKPLSNVEVFLVGDEEKVITNTTGEFILLTTKLGPQILIINKQDFEQQQFSIVLEGQAIDLGTISLQLDISVEKIDNLITLTDADLSDDFESISASTGLLQATRDIFLNRAAFDFGQAFFRVKGYDSKEGLVLINGMPMNKLFNGRPQWNNWGGLNDVMRNQEFTNGLSPSSYTFGGILGNTNINTSPSGQRPGTRLSTSISNRTYGGRIMVTYNSGLKENGLAYSLSASRRWANEGYIDGTLYDAHSFFGALEYQWNTNNGLLLSGILAKNRRGRSSAITEEVFDLVGKRYNPYWGAQDGEIRNSRERNLFEPIVMLNHFYQSERLTITSGIAYQTGTHSRSRLGYFNAPNPDPIYYRYLPSYYINNSIGSDFTNANLAREGFLDNAQIQWEQLYTANSNPENLGKAAYVLYHDVVADTQLSLSTAFNLKPSKILQFDFGGTYRLLTSENYAQIEDLLGATFHEDIDPFSDTLNDVNSEPNKAESDIFNYHHDFDSRDWNAFGQIKFQHKKWSGFLSGQLSGMQVQRLGRFQNERFLEDSFGDSETLSFTNQSAKIGVTYQITGRHWVNTNGAYITRPPVLQNMFINPRENNQTVPSLQSETLNTLDFSYFIRLPDLTGRLTGFYTLFQNTTDINFFYVDSGIGSDFVQEVITDLDKLHMGIELGLEYQVSPQVKLSAVANIGKYVYASNPKVAINFDTAGAEEDLIDPEGNIDLGSANIKDLKLGQGPQTAMALGIEYRDPKYWWVGATTNYLADNHANISTITRTPSFVLNPDTGEPFPEATPENVASLLHRQSLDDFYLLNLVGGKSWLIDGKYISVFTSINNAFDAVFRTGGYEQSRNGNFGQLQQDNLRDNPSFAPKYWYGFGRTYFLNLAIGF